jgi:ATP adenylyltransferase
MERLWAPWRMEFILNEKLKGCVFCLEERRDAASEKERLVLFRDRLSFVMMNRYPYCNGHLLIAPYRHVADLAALTDNEMLELFVNVRLCCRVIGDALAPQGFNIGVNLGKAAGAGIDDHLHIHVVPRWGGDTNYMTIVADVRVMPENLAATYDKLIQGFKDAAVG